MAEYWGARAYWPRTPYGLSHYNHIEEVDIQFTMPEGHSSSNIGLIRQQIMAQHPEDISALADQWQNAYNLLDSIHQQLYTQAKALEAQSWNSPEARDEFLRAGPGKTLAYLDEWKEAAYNNVAVLRNLVGVVRDSRAEMEGIWRRYLDALDAARDVSFGENLGAWVTGFTVTWDQAKAQEQINDLREVETAYNGEAQRLAFRVATQYFETISRGAQGNGPPFSPMDARLDPPDVDWPALPPIPGSPDLPAMPSLPLPPVLPVPPTPPGMPASPEMDGVQTQPPVVPGAPVLPVAGLLPGLGGTAPNPYGAGARGAGLPGLPGPGAFRPPTLPPGTPRNGVLGRRGNRSEDPRVHGPAPTEEEFSVPPGNTAPPVVRNPRAIPPRRGKGVPVPGIGDEEFAAPPLGASPPVIGGPGRVAPPARPVAPWRTSTPAKPGEGDFDHLGLRALRAGAGEPVVDAPEPAAAPSTDASAALRGGRPAAGADELATRRPGQPQPAAVAEFDVPTPGGPVVAKSREENDVRSEPPAALSGPGTAGGG